MIRVLNPTFGDVTQGAALAPVPVSLDGATIGIISNGKAGTRVLFDYLERLVRKEWGVAEVVRRTKSNYSAPAEAELINEAAQWAVMFAGVGD